MVYYGLVWYVEYDIILNGMVLNGLGMFYVKHSICFKFGNSIVKNIPLQCCPKQVIYI